MKKMILLASLFVVGCGGSSAPKPEARQYSEAEKAAIRAADKTVDDEERSGAGTATKQKK
jgi:hypothetical protein